ncbi:MAG TPA: trypsin-like peptidase domain-containing protein, partial [Polyangiaceae bacterium]
MNPLPRRALRCAPVLLGALAVVATLGRDRSAHADCFGHDSRVDLAHASPAWQARGRSVAALVAKKNVAVDAQHNITLTGPRVGAEEKLCPGQAFSTDVESAECTAFLIDRRRMVTAGHCLYPGIGPSLADLQAGCSNYFAIFDDAKDASGAVPHLTETANLFQCRRVLLYGAGGTTDDSAIFELDRDAGRPPLPLADDRTTPVAVAVGAPCAARSCVMGIGTPSGEPLKLAGPGTVVFLDPFGLAFKATLDGFHATSGSPVFDAVTGVVMGIDTLAANGGSDYVPNPANPSCNVVEVLPPGGSPRNGNYGNIGGASQITRIQRVFNREKQRDFDRDKRADILWRHDDGRLAIWEMNGAAVLHEGELEVVSNATKVVGTGDFDGDLHADILWERSNGLDIWEMNGLDIKLDG